MDVSIQQTSWIQGGADPYKWARAVALAALTFVALRQLPGYNPGIEFVLLAAIMLLASVSLPGAILVSLLAVGFPVFYSSPVIGIAFAVVAVVSFQYLSLVDGRAFFLLGFLLISAFFRMEWAFPLLAGFYLAGTSSFALGFSGILVVEVVGLLLGRQAIGTIFTHGSKVLWTIPRGPLPSVLDWAWVATKLSGGAPIKLLTAFSQTAIASAALIVQPLAWGLVGAFVGSSAEKRWKNVLVVFPLAILALFTVSLIVGSMNHSLPPGGLQSLLVRAALGFVVAMAPVAVTLVVQQRKEAEGVSNGAVSTGSTVTPAPETSAQPAVTAMDSLTGLFRREHLEVSLPSRLEAARQSSQPVAFAMIDLDRFKQVNDTKGHQAGDRVLQDVAGLLRSTVGPAGDVVRYGGDEFCVILPAADAESAKQMMNGAATELEGLTFTGLENVLRPTFSIGIAEYPKMATTKEDLIERADQALYISKNMGRNTITVYGEQVFREQALELACWMAMQCFLTVNGRIRADSWRLHPGQKAIEIVTAFDYTATIPYVSKTASLVTETKTFKSSFEGKILKIVSMTDHQTQFILLVQKADLPVKIQEHLTEFGSSQNPGPAPSEQNA